MKIKIFLTLIFGVSFFLIASKASGYGCADEGGQCQNDPCYGGFIEDDGLECVPASAICCMPDSDGDGTPTGGTVGDTTGTPTGGTAGAKLSGKGIEIPTGTGLPDPQGGIAKIIRNLLTWLLGIVGVIAIIGFVISGIQYLTSAGDEDRMQSAKRNMLYAIIGVVVVLSSFVVIQAIQYALEARSMF